MAESKRLHATRIKVLPKGSVHFQIVSKTTYEGIIIEESKVQSTHEDFEEPLEILAGQKIPGNNALGTQVFCNFSRYFAWMGLNWSTIGQSLGFSFNRLQIKHNLTIKNKTKIFQLLEPKLHLNWWKTNEPMSNKQPKLNRFQQKPQKPNPNRMNRMTRPMMIGS